MSSYSLLSTKRKFHRLLDSLSNGGTSSNSGTNAAGGNPSNDKNDGNTMAVDASTGPRPLKRLRPAAKQRSQLVASSPHLTALLSRHASRTTSANSQLSLKTGFMSSGGSSLNATPGEVSRLPPTTWNPKDKAAFMERVETFQSAGDWTFKRDEICAVGFAKLGWKLVDVETVQCVSCYRRFVVYVRYYPPERTQGEATPAGDDREATGGPYTEEKEEREDHHSDLFVEKTITRMVEEHDESCLWRKKSCDPSIWSLTLWPASKSVEALRQRYLGMLKYADVLPTHVAMPESLEHGEQSIAVLTELLGRTTSSSSEPHVSDEYEAQSAVAYSLDIRQRALAIALLGWSLVPQLSNQPPKEALVHCEQCLARVGLWLFWPKSSGREPTYDEFDITHHSMACPWSSAESQNGGMKLDEGTTPKAGWEILRSMLVSHAVSAERQREATAALSTSHVLSASANGRPQTPTYDGSRPSSASGTPKLTDEERRKKHKLGMAWLSKLKVGGKSTKKDNKLLGDIEGAKSASN